jgi:hypothetical protein
MHEANNVGSLCGKVDERQSALIVMSSAQMHWHFGNDHFQCRPNSSSQKMSAVSGAILLSHNYMSMEGRLGVPANDVAGK